MTIPVSKRLTLDGVLVIDTDIHAHESPAELVPYTDRRWRTAMENLINVPRRYLDIPGFAPTGEVPSLSSYPASRGKRVEVVSNAAQMSRELREFGIDVGVIIPDHFLKIAGIANADWALAIARAYHRWLKECWVHEENDLYAAIMVVPQNIDGSIEEIEQWAGDERFVAVFLPVSEVYPLWGNHKYHRIYEVAQHYNLPVIMHSVTGLASSFPFNLEQFYTTYSSHTVSHVFAMMANLMSVMETGVPVRFPKLRICFQESGLTWVPFMRMRLDKEYNENRSAWAHFDDRPSKWISNFYFATQPVEEPDNRQDLIDLIRIYKGEDTTVFASDWPHHDFDHPRAVFNLPVTDVLKRKFMGANALRLMPKIKVPPKYACSYQQGETL